MMFREIAVLGRGTMGHQISALLSQENLCYSLSSGHDPPSSIRVVDLVIENVSEDRRAKLNLYGKVCSIVKGDCVIATNTSAIPISDLAAGVTHPERFCGLHFFNPVDRMPLVEVVTGKQTSKDTVESLCQFAVELGKTPIIVQEVSLVNRVLFPALQAATELVEHENLSAMAVDEAVKLGLNWRVGPLKLIDYIGVDTVVVVLEEQGMRVSPVLAGLKQTGRLGKKTGEGFYKWKE